TFFKYISIFQVEQHCTHESLWLIFRGKVYDLTSYYPQHPGGTAMLRKAGKVGDATIAIQIVQSHAVPWNFIQKKLEECLIGVVKK
ncbi:hypothetical protein PFISCL1PPCAC_3784, partial [Pristionchus fissidentatus]